MKIDHYLFTLILMSFELNFFLSIFNDYIIIIFYFILFYLYILLFSLIPQHKGQ